jgi:hypothetical protein
MDDINIELMRLQPEKRRHLGEALDALYVARKAGLHSNRASLSLECAMLAHQEPI